MLLTGVRRQLRPGGKGASFSGAASVELQGLLALVHDRVPRAVRRMDRVHVGLHLVLVVHLHSVLPAHHDHRQPRRAYSSLVTHSP